ncbi:hypothetical protein SAMN03159341_1046 [Paenibacillus sp. 1_12]|nr:hypothetical protein SAMN03159341_1046 [Paenibacillus sp. 1_12]
MSYTIEFIKSMFPDSLTAAIAISITILVFWMYKELRSTFLESSKSNQQRIDKALDVYSDLEFEIFKYFNGRSDFFTVTEKISKTVSLLPYDLLKKYIKFKVTTDEALKNDLLLEFHKEIESEIYRLKLKQIDSVTLKNDKGIWSSVDLYIRTKVAPFGIPLIYTYLNLTLLMLLALLTISIVGAASIEQQIMILSLFLSGIFYFAVLYLIINEGFIKKRFKHSLTNWIVFLIFAIGLPLVVFFTGFWFKGIIVLILVFIFAYYAGRKSMREPVV